MNFFHTITKGHAPLYTISMSGKSCAKREVIATNVDYIVEFDRRYQAALVGRDINGMKQLARWAEGKGLTLGHKAAEAAEEMDR